MRMSAKRKRVLISLEHREPDIVPITELEVDIPILQKIIGANIVENGVTSTLVAQVSANRKAEVSKRDMEIYCAKKFFDMICVDLSAPDGFEAKTRPDGTRIDEWGRVMGYDEVGKCWNPIGSRSIFTSTEEVENFFFPDPHAPGRTFGLEYVKKTVRDNMAIATFIRDPFSHAWEVLSPINFVKWMYEKPQTLKFMFNLLTSFNVEIIKRVAEVGADLIISGGDYAEEKGPIVPVKFFSEVIFPNLREQVKAAHKAGLSFIKHSDGNIVPLVKDLSEIVDGLHSLDPTAGVDIGKIKEEYGDKLVLIGNISVDNLARKNTGEIAEETVQCLKKTAPSGGYILSSSNSWYGGVKLKNCITMVETGRKYGKYPIKIT